MLALLGAHRILHVIRVRVKVLCYMLDIHQQIDYVSGLFLTIWILFNALQSWQNVHIISLHMRLDSWFLILVLKNSSCRMYLIFNLHMMYEKAIMIVFSLIMRGATEESKILLQDIGLFVLIWAWIMLLHFILTFRHRASSI